jgi:hypothetical protein
MTKLERFFYDNAGYSYNPETETPEDGKRKGAIALAAAVRFALENGWRFDWDNDTDEPCNCGESDCDHTVEFCLLTHGDTLLGSLSGICGATENYRRVVEAELALEAMRRA